jgi:hexosaminidase
MLLKMFSDLSCLLLLLLAGQALAIWPTPQKISTGKKVLFIAQSVEVTYNGEPVCYFCSTKSNPPAGPYFSSNYVQDTESMFHKQLTYAHGYEPGPGGKFSSKDIVQGGLERAFTAIFQQNFVPWKLHTKNSEFEPDVMAADKAWLKAVQITQTGVDEPNAFKPLAGESDESYALTVSADGVAKISAKSSTGILRGLETFVQLFYQHTTGTFTYTPYAPVAIEDAPKYPHRGVLLDVARNWYPVKDILKVIDALSMNKLNRLHIHMTDSQSWPLDIPALPELSAKGAYRKGLSYTPADIATIHEYAVHRGIEVIVEIDMPGHIGSVAFAYPELIVAYNEQPYHWWCLEPPCGAFKLNSTKVDAFLETLFDDLLPRLAPYTAYFHTGGDEINKNDSMLDEGVRSNSTSVLQPLLQRFVESNHRRVRAAGLTPMVWEEIPLEWNVTLGKDVVVQTWLGAASVKKLTGSGLKIIDSNADFWVRPPPHLVPPLHDLDIYLLFVLLS